MLGIR
ncbi:hypothetical protein CGLO_01054 [Colletotrichum gloeosporioides Cg-14]